MIGNFCSTDIEALGFARFGLRLGGAAEFGGVNLVRCLLARAGSADMSEVERPIGDLR